MSERLQILVSPELSRRIRKAAERNRMSRSRWVRGLIERALAEDGAERDPLAALSRLDAPTADIEDMLAEIEAGRT